MANIITITSHLIPPAVALACAIAAPGMLGQGTPLGAAPSFPSKPACEKEDRALNEAFRAIMRRLDAAMNRELQENSREWIRHRDYLCGYQAAMRLGKDDARDDEYYQCLRDLTRDRTAYIRAAFGKTSAPSGVDGAYGDGFGGVMTLRTHTDGSVHFTIEVVRGPTFHLGSISGDIAVRGGTAEFREKEPCAGDGCCRIEFAFGKHWIDVREHACAYHHGARAFFDGRYRRVGKTP